MSECSSRWRVSTIGFQFKYLCVLQLHILTGNLECPELWALSKHVLPVLGLLSSSTFTGSSSMCLSSEASGHNPFVDYPSQQLDVILPDQYGYVSKWRNRQILCDLLILELGNCKFLGVIDFETSKCYNLSTAFLESESLAVISRSTTPT